VDLEMPGIDGIELGRRLQAEQHLKAITLVMMTPVGNWSDTEYFADLGFGAYCTKPITPSDLLGALKLVKARTTQWPFPPSVTPLVSNPSLPSEVNGPGANGPEYFNLESKIPSPLLWPSQARLLLVEDHPVNQLVVKSLVNKLGLAIDLAANGVEALQVLAAAPASHPYTLILMDCQMPEMDGYEASRQIRQGQVGEHNQQVTIIALTANAMKGDRERCLQAGMDDYLAKPVKLAALQQVLHQWILEPSSQRSLVVTSNE
jgi:CheY-like chemotaxis protein